MLEQKFTCKLISIDSMFDIVKLKEKEPDLFNDLVNDYPTTDKNIFIVLEKVKDDWFI